MATSSIIGICALLLQVVFLAGVLAMRWKKNPELFNTKNTLQPIRTKNIFFAGATGLFDLLDRIPFLRRSGTANEFDLLKGMLITVVPILGLQLLSTRASLTVALLGLNFVLILINAILLAHPTVKRLTR